MESGGADAAFVEPTGYCPAIEAFESLRAMVGKRVPEPCSRTIRGILHRARTAAAGDIRRSRGDFARTAGRRIHANRFRAIGLGERSLAGSRSLSALQRPG